MPVTMQWDNEAQDIIRYVFEGKWTWEELYATMQEAKSSAGNKSHRVDVIISYDIGVNLPKNFVTHMRGIANRQIENAGITVIRTKNRFLTGMLKVSRQVDGTVNDRIHCVETDEEAYQLIEQSRAKDGTHS